MSEQQNLIVPDFIDVDASAVTAAEAGLAARSGAGWAIPEGTKMSGYVGKTRKQNHGRWTAEGTIESAYRTVSTKGLLDVVLGVKARVGQPNEGLTQFFHLYINNAVLNGTASEEELKKHGRMTEDSMGLIAQLLKAAGLFPQSGGFKASLLGMLFPNKNQPGVAPSPLVNKTVIVNVHASLEKKMVTTPADEEKGIEAVTEEVEDLRLQPDSFLVAK